MSDVRIFKNDGTQMFAEDPSRIEYIDPGVVLLYADLRKRRVCSYFEGVLGQSIQATIEYTFDDAIDLDEIKHRLNDLGALDLTVQPAPEDNSNSSRWALHGLYVDEVGLDDLGLEDPDIIHRLVEGEPVWVAQSSSGIIPDWLRWSYPKRETQNLDFAVANTRDGARLFRAFVEELQDTDATIAMSKSGRVSEIAAADIVIHVDSDRVSEGHGQSVVAIDDTSRVIDGQKAKVASDKFGENVQEPLKQLQEAYVESTTSDGLDRSTASEILQTNLNRWLSGSTPLEVVSSRRTRIQKALIGLGTSSVGFVTGVLVSDWIIESVQLAVNTVQKAYLGAATSARAVTGSLSGSDLLYVVTAVLSLLIVIGTLAFWFHHLSGWRDGKSVRTARADALHFGLIAISVFSVLVLVGSILMLSL